MCVCVYVFHSVHLICLLEMSPDELELMSQLFQYFNGQQRYSLDPHFEIEDAHMETW